MLEMDGLRQMPHSVEAEQSVLGAILIDPQCITEVMDTLKPKFFYISQHREIFECMATMFNLNRNIDLVTLLEELKTRGVYTEAGGKTYLFQLAQAVPTTANIRSYAKIVEEKYLLRSLIEAAGSISDNCYSQGDNVRNIMDAAEQKIYSIMQDGVNKSLVPLKEVILETYDRLHKLSGENRAEYLGLPTGFVGVDHLLGGLNKSDLILVAARPGMGKTSFVLNMAQNVAEKSKKAVCIFQLEMSAQQLAARLIASESLVDSHKLNTGEIDSDDWEKIAYAADVLSKVRIYIDDTASITVTEMKAKLRRIKDLGLVVIDYLQLMQSGTRNDNRVNEVSEITRSLKIMARELNVPVLVCSQLSRATEARQDKHPMLSDLRESGSIEQDADIVMFLYREDYYKQNGENQNIAECIVSKNRHGSTGKIELQWIGQFTKFSTSERIHNEPN